MIHRHPIGDQCLPLCEQEENAAHRADFELRCSMLPIDCEPPFDAIEWWMHQARVALDSYRNRNGKVEAVGRLYHCCKELAALAREQPSEEELHDDVASVLDDTIGGV